MPLRNSPSHECDQGGSLSDVSEVSDLLITDECYSMASDEKIELREIK